MVTTFTLVLLILTTSVFAIVPSPYPARWDSYSTYTHEIIYKSTVSPFATYLLVATQQFYTVKDTVTLNGFEIKSTGAIKSFRLDNHANGIDKYWQEIVWGSTTMNQNKYVWNGDIIYCTNNINNPDGLTYPNVTVPPMEDCTIYKVGAGDTINIRNDSTTDKFFYFKAINVTYEKVVTINARTPVVINYTNLSSGTWEWMEPEAKSVYNYWKIKQGTIEIGVPKDSTLIVKVTRKSPDVGYSITPAPIRSNYEEGVFGSLSYAMDTLIYWISYPFVAIARLFEMLINLITDSFGWVEGFTNLLKVLFGWLPEPLQGLLIIAVTAYVISFIIRVFRGS